MSTISPGRLSGLVAGYEGLFLDEAQRIPGVGLVLKRLHDQHPEVRLLVTGSSSLELAGQTREALTGRSCGLSADTVISYLDLLEAFEFKWGDRPASVPKGFAEAYPDSGFTLINPAPSRHPRIEYRHPGGGEVVGVAGSQHRVVLQRKGREKRVDHRQRSPGPRHRSLQHAPAMGHGCMEAQNPFPKTRLKLIEPYGKVGPAVPGWQAFDPLAQFAQHQRRYKHFAFVQRFHPSQHPAIGLRFERLADHTGVEQNHSKLTWRPSSRERTTWSSARGADRKKEPSDCFGATRRW